MKTSPLSGQGNVVYKSPSEGCEKIREGCLPWGEDSGYKDKLPSVRTLSEIKERILTERRLAEMAPRLKALAQIAGSLTGLPVAERVVVLQGMQALIASELMGLVGQGQRVLDHLPAVDRVIRAVSAQARVEQTAERNRLQEKALEIRKSMFEIRKEEWEFKKAESGKRPMIGSKAETKAEEAGEDEPWDPVAEQEKVRRMTERIYGKNPNKLKEEAKTNVTGANVTLDPNKKTNDECKMTDGEGTKTVVTVNDANKAKGKQVKQQRRKDAKGGQKSNDETGVPPEKKVEDEYNKPNLPNGKPWWWQEGTILISGPCKEYPKGVARDVVTNLPYCMATGRPACVATN